MIEVFDLAFQHQDASEFLFKQLAFSLNTHTALHILGGNGSGKTTCLNCLAGLMTPTEGKVIVKSTLCYVGHHYGVNQNLTPLEHIKFDLDVYEKAKQKDLLEQMNLIHVQNTPCMYLSSGEKRKVSLLRLLTSQAKLWLLDEPFVGLDEKAVHQLGRLMCAHLESGGSIVFTSHQKLEVNIPNLILFQM